MEDATAAHYDDDASERGYDERPRRRLGHRRRFGHRRRAQDEIVRGRFETEGMSKEGHIALFAAVRGALRGERVDVAHGIAGLKRAEVYIRGHRIQSEPRIERIAVVIERL